MKISYGILLVLTYITATIAQECSTMELSYCLENAAQNTGHVTLTALATTSTRTACRDTECVCGAAYMSSGCYSAYCPLNTGLAADVSRLAQKDCVAFFATFVDESGSPVATAGTASMTVAPASITSATSTVASAKATSSSGAAVGLGGAAEVGGFLAVFLGVVVNL